MGSKLFQSVFLVTATLVFAVTGLALSNRFASFAEPVWSQVFGNQFVSVAAMSFSCVLSCQCITSKQIGLVVYYFKVARVYAATVSAKVVADVFRRRNDFYEHLIYQSVSNLGKAIALKRTEASVSAISSAMPFPAWRSVIKRSATYFHLAKDAAHDLTIKLQSGMYHLLNVLYYNPCSKGV